MKKKWLTLLALLCCGSVALGISACKEENQEHEHAFGDWIQTETHHIKACDCGAEEKVSHTYDEAGKCTVCGVWYGTDGLEYSLLRQNGEYVYEVKSRGSAADTEIVIPSFYNGKKVTSIGYKAFSTFDVDDSLKNLPPITKITLPNTITSIKSRAFEGCDKVENIIIPDTVTFIGTEAFNCCVKLSSIVIPDGVTSIGDYAFNYCSNLTSIIIPDSVTSIGEYAFYSCTGLTSATFENPNGWFVSTSSAATNGTNLTLTDPSTNATYLTSTYQSYYWKRNR